MLHLSHFNSIKPYFVSLHFKTFSTSFLTLDLILFSYIFKLLFNCIKSIYLYFKIHPDYIITTGTHTAGPICYFGKIFGSRVIYIETFANITTKTITGKLIYPIADLFVVQWKSMLELYPKAKFGGWIF